MLAVAVAGMLAVDRSVAAEGGVAWATGPALQERLDAKLDLIWSGSANPLQAALAKLSRAERVAVLLDRRVDPDQNVAIKLVAVPLVTALGEIAHSRQLGVAMLGPVAYFGPPEAAARLPPLSALREEEVRRLRPATARRLLLRKPLVWRDYAAPRDVLGQLAEQGGVELLDREQVPHDLWAAADLPALPWVDRVTLIVNQFDLTFQVAADGRSVRLVPVPQGVASSADVAGPRPAPRAEPAGNRPPLAARLLVTRLSVREKPLAAVLEQLAVKLNFELRLDRPALRAAGISLDQRVSLEVENATVDDVLRALLRTTPLTYRRHGNLVEVVPR
ncbi:MAG: STN domain-containing protein [Thermoguttaceae bacterium]